MYEQNFGLKKRPFPALATGSDVFVGPQAAKTMAGFRKALATQDAVVVVSGPVGTGKTTLVHRALEGIGSKYKTIRVGRMKMDANDVLESLLVVLGVQDRPAGTIRRFSALRKKLKDLQDAEVQVFIVVEEALRTGIETLAELEALTAADAGDSDGASIILMGDERITEFMNDPELAQLQQRIRQRHCIAALCAAEMRGYLMHGFRKAGGDFEHIFDDRSSDLLHQLSGGIPRIANALIESVLTAAAGTGMSSVPATFVATIASDEFGLGAENFDFSMPESDPAPETEPDDAVHEDQDEIPHLIHDTLPDLRVLAPQYATLDNEAELQAEEPEEFEAPAASPDNSEAVVEIEAEPVELVIPELTPEPVAEPGPDLKVVEQPVAEFIPELVAEEESVAEFIPELVAEEELLAEDIPVLALELEADAASVEAAAKLDPEPVVAELKPDLDALEQAMAYAKGTSAKNDNIPEITLDKAIETGIGTPFDDESEAAEPPQPAKLPGAELDKIAVEIGNAKTLDDIDDKMAETLFGTGLSMITAQMIANPPAGTPANDDLQLEPGESTPAQEIFLESVKTGNATGIDLTKSQRLKMARALNTDLRAAPSDTESKTAENNAVVDTPKPIEDQISTSLTNTLKALEVPDQMPDDEPEEQTRSGFFSRFRRS